MAEEKQEIVEQEELTAYQDAIVSSGSKKRLVVSGPGTGKTTLFKKLLTRQGRNERTIVLTLVNNLKDDLQKDLGKLAKVDTLHSYCLRLLYSDSAARGALSPLFNCYPGLASIIKKDWKFITKSEAPKFIPEMRDLSEGKHVQFYLARGEYYDAVDYDDMVYRAYTALHSGRAGTDSYGLVLIDEYQDFNALEAEIIHHLAESGPILIAGDDDQALYSQLRGASWEYIRLLCKRGEYKVFHQPYCLRCTRVVVDAVNDVVSTAKKMGKLKGRIEKPFRYFSPVKGPDSMKYPKIAHVETSVQNRRANYMGRYLARSIAQIPHDEIDEAKRKGYAAALVIVEKPYHSQIVSYLEEQGYVVEAGRKSSREIIREDGILMLRDDDGSSLGWRIVLDVDEPDFLSDAVEATADGITPLVDVIPEEFRKRVLDEVDEYEPPDEEESKLETAGSDAKPTVKATSFHGAKGLTAQHVYIVGLHNGELPRNPESVKDLEICKFVVALTRARKKCTLLRTRRFGEKVKEKSCFISWIKPDRLEPILKVNKGYWTK